MQRIMKNPLLLLLVLWLLFENLTSGQYGGPLDWLMAKLYIVPGIVIGLSFHEFAHAKAAVLCGDDTPRLQGRVTIHPAAHIDPVGLIALFFIGFGWGRPVEINPRNFRNMRRDEIFVGLAGVTMNLFIAVIAFIVMRVLHNISQVWPGMNLELLTITYIILANIARINIVLMVFNLIPVPPLDGFGVLAGICNFRYKKIYYDIYQYGWIILMAMLVLNLHRIIMTPAVEFVFDNLWDLII